MMAIYWFLFLTGILVGIGISALIVLWWIWPVFWKVFK